MPRKVLLPTVALALVAAACAPNLRSFAPTETGLPGKVFVPQVVDIKENSGVGVSLAVDREGTPFVSYLRLDEEERIPQAPTPDDPKKLPAVMTATFVPQEGIWVREVAAQDQKGLTEDDTTDIAVDATGARHLVWSAGGKAIAYATDGGDPVPQAAGVTPEEVAKGDVFGPSIAAGSDGPVIAYYDKNAVKVATRSGKSWTVRTVATAAVGDDRTALRTDVAVAGDGTTFVAYGSGGGTSVARGKGGAFTKEVADPDGGLGVSLTLDGGGAPHLAYYTPSGEVKHAQAEGASWHVSTVTDQAGSPNSSWSTGIALDGDDNHYVVWFDSRAKAAYYATSGDGDSFDDPIPMPGGALGGDPHVAAAGDSVQAAWQDTEGTQLVVATYAEREPPLAEPSPSAPIAAPSPTAAACKPGGTTLELTAQNIQFDKDCLAAPAGKAFTISFTNDDAGTPHNVAIYTDESASQELFVGDIVTGPTTTAYKVDAIKDSGDFYFHCDVHPTMNGTFVVA